MNITIHSRAIGSQHTQTVNAHELHGFLDVQTRYNDWIKNRIEQYGFGEGTDFLTLTENLVSGGTQKTHHVTVDMAKELAMVERNDKGREARKYFIECERRLKTGGSKIPQIETAKHVFEAVGVAADVLRCSDSSRLAMLHKAASPWPLLQSALPVYAVDAPPTARQVAARQQPRSPKSCKASIPQPRRTKLYAMPDCWNRKPVHPPMAPRKRIGASQKQVWCTGKTSHPQATPVRHSLTGTNAKLRNYARS